MGTLPLLGLRVLNTRAPEDSEELHRLLREMGAEVLSLPATRTGPPDDPGPLDAAIAAIIDTNVASPAFDWIAFTSAHAVSAFMNRLLGNNGEYLSRASGSVFSQASRALNLGALSSTRLAVVGPATQAALERYGLFADLIPDRAAGRHLATAFGDVSGLRILLPRSSVALRDLPDALTARGASVTEVVAYATRPAPADPGILKRVLAGEVDAATFFSPSGIEGLATQLSPQRIGEVLGGAAIVCVGETTGQAARTKGLTEVVVAGEAAAAGVVAALVHWRRGRVGGD